MQPTIGAFAPIFSARCPRRRRISSDWMRSTWAITRTELLGLDHRVDEVVQLLDLVAARHAFERLEAGMAEPGLENLGELQGEGAVVPTGRETWPCELRFR